MEHYNKLYLKNFVSFILLVSLPYIISMMKYMDALMEAQSDSNPMIGYAYNLTLFALFLLIMLLPVVLISIRNSSEKEL